MGSQGRAEGESADQLSQTFYPVKEHLRMLDPEVVLVVGPRGSGKSEICRVLTDTDLLDAVVQESGGRSLPPPENMEWRKAFPLGRGGFDAGGLRRFLDHHGDSVQFDRRFSSQSTPSADRDCHV